MKKIIAIIIGFSFMAPQSGVSSEKSVYVSATQALKKGQDYLFNQKKDSGYWEGRFYSDTSFTSYYIIMSRYLQLTDDQPILKKMENHLLYQQNLDGSWSLYPDGPGNLGLTVLNYLALTTLYGESEGRARPMENESALRAAAYFINSYGGIDQANSITKIFLALYGIFPWEKLPDFPLSLFGGIGEAAPLQIDDINWLRVCVTAYAILKFHGLSVNLSNEQRGFFNLLSIPSEGFTKVKHGVRIKLQNLDHGVVLVKTLFPPTGEHLNIARAKLLENIEDDGSVGLNQPAAVLTLLALHSEGYALDDTLILKILGSLRQHQSQYWNFSSQVIQQFSESSVWDTAFSLIALQGRQDLHTDNSIKWLTDHQILEPKRDQIPSGGWAFEKHNRSNPDSDVTAMASLALIGNDPQVIERGRQFILSMQNADGGWPAFDKNTNVEALRNHAFEDTVVLRDMSTNDVTCHALYSLAHMGMTLEDGSVKRGVKFVLKNMEPIGVFRGWRAQWGMNYLYATSACLKALKVLQFDFSRSEIRDALWFIRSRQNNDGGWGEVPESDTDSRWAGRGPSRPTTTAYALSGLLTDGTVDATIEAGIQWLANNQTRAGSWDESKYFNAMNFPQRNYAHYEYYPLYFPLIALREFVEVSLKNPEVPQKNKPLKYHRFIPLKMWP